MTGQTKQVVKHLVIFFAVAAPLFSLGISNHGVWFASEPRVAEIGREMSATGNWAVPTLNQRPFLEEPPLYYGFLALAFKAFEGAADSVARIPSALFAFAGLPALFFFANFLFGPRIALISALVLATTGEYFRIAHWVIVDGALTFFVICAMGCFITGYLARSNRTKTLCYTLLYVSCTLAFYVKGFIGIVIPGLTALVFLAFERNLKELVKMRLWLGMFIFLVLAFPWFNALWRQGGAEHLRVFLVYNHLQRFFPASMAREILRGRLRPPSSVLLLHCGVSRRLPSLEHSSSSRRYIFLFPEWDQPIVLQKKDDSSRNAGSLRESSFSASPRLSGSSI